MSGVIRDQPVKRGVPGPGCGSAASGAGSVGALLGDLTPGAETPGIRRFRGAKAGLAGGRAYG